MALPYPVRAQMPSRRLPYAVRQPVVEVPSQERRSDLAGDLTDLGYTTSPMGALSLDDATDESSAPVSLATAATDYEVAEVEVPPGRYLITANVNICG